MNTITVMNKRSTGASSQATSSQSATPSKQGGVGSSIQSLPGKEKEKHTQASIDQVGLLVSKIRSSNR